jgi:hypothetical protein
MQCDVRKLNMTVELLGLCGWTRDLCQLVSNYMESSSLMIWLVLLSMDETGAKEQSRNKMTVWYNREDLAREHVRRQRIKDMEWCVRLGSYASRGDFIQNCRAFIHIVNGRYGIERNIPEHTVTKLYVLLRTESVLVPSDMFMWTEDPVCIDPQTIDTTHVSDDPTWHDRHEQH